MIEASCAVGLYIQLSKGYTEVILYCPKFIPSVHLLWSGYIKTSKWFSVFSRIHLYIAPIMFLNKVPQYFHCIHMNNIDVFKLYMQNIITNLRNSTSRDI